ncbi:hypothetical protein SCLCIDRAFT_1217752 [Scleroderma citrinum Foug A]|uniref:Uncharacterized protein n=1 Tax=Scleroderma citrinum Foug A TaxID=1036808 RepID=A0A0C3DFB7_9AGAM|nr:hypothetical protein SCLCIDRAFT_1217752 [Scleroderma citrinum Foug A]
MLNTCPLNTGVYTIIAKTGPVGAGYCGNRVVVNKPSDFFIVRNQRGPDDCTYSLYTLDKKQVFSESGNVVIENNDIVNEWVITALGGNIYT